MSDATDFRCLCHRKQGQTQSHLLCSVWLSAMVTRPLSEVWCLAIQGWPPTDALFRLTVPESWHAPNASTEFIEFWEKIASGPDVGALWIDATPLRLMDLRVEDFRAVFGALSKPKLQRVHLKLSCDILWPAYKEAMAAVLKDDSGAAVEERVEVESLWVEDAISQSYSRLAEDAASIKKNAAKALHPFSTYARIHMSDQERRVLCYRGMVQRSSVADKSIMARI